MVVLKKWIATMYIDLIGNMVIKFTGSVKSIKPGCVWHTLENHNISVTGNKAQLEMHYRASISPRTLECLSKVCQEQTTMQKVFTTQHKAQL